ncbi:hypothetical protein CK203_100972 [Vitis vinifera]|uniref:CS domain-containing protein n=1 Tax=Vitis vinifera TaxID=29760 RepID=A0A438D2D7_VITVI|nr:hypothetical protein CK203_100972 [Vitis vinifera]
MSEKLAPEKRHSFFHGSQKVFEWDQTLEEVNVYITLPPNVPQSFSTAKSNLNMWKLASKATLLILMYSLSLYDFHPLFVGFVWMILISDSFWHDLSCPVKTDSSFWTLESICETYWGLMDNVIKLCGQFIKKSKDDTLHITLQKREKGHTWSSPIVGEGQLDPYSTDLEQKRLMLQRFQEEASNCAFFQLF